MEIFAKIWDCENDELITSFDNFITYRPWWFNKINGENWRPKTMGLHCDQNPVKKKGFHCVQGMIPLFPVDTKTGGLTVIPNTHTEAF